MGGDAIPALVKAVQTGDDTTARFAALLLGLILLPAIVFLAIVGSITLVLPGGDDCLGYTTLASRGDSVED